VNRQNEFKNNHQGLMFSTSVGGALTGEGGDCIILDDPQNPLQANSETEREATIAFFKNTLQSRLNDPKTGVFIVVMQRLHEKDLTGHILAEDLGYTHLCLPAEAPQRTIITFPVSGREVIREEGDILNPQRFDKETLASLKKSMGSLQYAGQYEQTPAPADGLIFKREWLQNFFDPKAAPHQSMLIQSWDMAFTKSEGSAKVAGYIVGRSGADIYIWDLVNEKMTFTESVAAVRTLTGKKQERALSVTPYFEAGNIHFPKPETAPWVHDTIQDLLMFPKGEYKDDIDALVQAILYLMDKPAKSPPKAEAMLPKSSYWRR
jgi:phage terminase large subunit-like protein